MGLIHGGVPSAFISFFGAWILLRQRKHAANLHEQLNGGLEERITKAVKGALAQTGEDA